MSREVAEVVQVGSKQTRMRSYEARCVELEERENVRKCLNDVSDEMNAWQQARSCQRSGFKSGRMETLCLFSSQTLMGSCAISSSSVTRPLAKEKLRQENNQAVGRSFLKHTSLATADLVLVSGMQPEPQDWGRFTI